MSWDTENQPTNESTTSSLCPLHPAMGTTKGAASICISKKIKARFPIPVGKTNTNRSSCYFFLFHDWLPPVPPGVVLPILKMAVLAERMWGLLRCRWVESHRWTQEARALWGRPWVEEGGVTGERGQDFSTYESKEYWGCGSKPKSKWGTLFANQAPMWSYMTHISADFTTTVGGKSIPSAFVLLVLKIKTKEFVGGISDWSTRDVLVLNV